VGVGDVVGAGVGAAVGVAVAEGVGEGDGVSASAGDADTRKAQASTAARTGPAGLSSSLA
jgi:hypothetical protein